MMLILQRRCELWFIANISTGGFKVTPADIVISRFDGVRALARLLGKDPSTIHRWKMPASKGGLDGRIPSSAQSRLLDLARERGISLSASDLISGSAQGVINQSQITKAERNPA